MPRERKRAPYCERDRLRWKRHHRTKLERERQLECEVLQLQEEIQALKVQAKLLTIQNLALRIPSNPAMPPPPPRPLKPPPQAELQACTQAAPPQQQPLPPQPPIKSPCSAFRSVLPPLQPPTESPFSAFRSVLPPFRSVLRRAYVPRQSCTGTLDTFPINVVGNEAVPHWQRLPSATTTGVGIPE